MAGEHQVCTYLVHEVAEEEIATFIGHDNDSTNGREVRYYGRGVDVWRDEGLAVAYA
jgi:hypothetical protein